MKTLIVISLLFSMSISAVTSKTASRHVAQEAQVIVEDIVYKFLPAEDQAHQVLFKRHSGIYYLKVDSKNYSVIKAALENSQKSGENIKVKADPTYLEIEEVILQTK